MFVQCYANMVDGVIVNLHDGDSEQAVARELERFPFDEIAAAAGLICRYFRYEEVMLPNSRIVGWALG